MLKSRIEQSLMNALAGDCQIKIDYPYITVMNKDRLLSQQELMQLFEVMFIYGYREEKLAYNNLRFIEENMNGERYVFVER